MVANFAHRVMGMASMILSVSWTVPYLGADRFGAWMTIASLAALMSFLDLGVANGLTNRVARAASSTNHDDLVRTISGGLGVLALLSAALMLLLLLAAWFAPWHLLVKADAASLTDEIRETSVVFAVLFALSVVLNGVLRIYHGLQRGSEVFVIGFVCSVVGLLLLYAATLYRAPLPILLLCSMGTTLLPGLWLWLRLKRRGLFKVVGWLTSTRCEGPELFRISSLFLVLQIGTAIGWGMDSLILSSTLGASTVAAYAVTQRMYFIATQPMIIFNGPLWPAYADADAREDRAFIRKTLLGAMKLTLTYAVIATALLATFSETIFRYWTSGEIAPASVLVYALGLWAIIDALANAFAMFMNGVGIVRPQVVAVVVIVAVGLPAKLYLANTMGAAAMVLGFAAIFMTTLCVLYGSVFRMQIAGKLHRSSRSFVPS